MQIRERVVSHPMRHASRFREWRELEDPMGAENFLFPDPGAHLGVHDEQIVVDVPAGAETAQRFLIGEQTLLPAEPRLRPKRHLVTRRLVLVENMPRKCDPLADRIVFPQLATEAVVRYRAAESAIRDTVIEPRERARARDIHRISRVVLDHRLRQKFAAAVDTLLMR